MALFDFSNLSGLLSGLVPGGEGMQSYVPQPWDKADAALAAARQATMSQQSAIPFASMTNANGLAFPPSTQATAQPQSQPSIAAPPAPIAQAPQIAQPSGYGSPSAPQAGSPQQPSPQQITNPFPENIGGILNGGGLSGGLNNLLQAVAPNVANTQYQRQMAQFSIVNTAQALMQRNPSLTPQQALATAMNPTLLESQTKPQVVQPGGQLVTPIDLQGVGKGGTTPTGSGVYQNSSGLIGDKTLTTMADQYLSGDPSVLQNLGRTAAGAINVQRLRDRIVQRMDEKGISPQDQAIRMAQFKGLVTSQQALGTRQATIGMAGSEVEQMAPLVIQASANVNRTSFPALNSVLLAAAKGTGDPNVVRLGQSVNSLINAYARAINPNGQSTVSDKDHARELLSGAWAHGQLSAGVDQLLREIAAAKRAPGITQKEISGLYAGKSAPVTSGITQSGINWSVQ